VVTKSSTSFAGVKAGMSPLPHGRQQCDPIWDVCSHSDETNCKQLYSDPFSLRNVLLVFYEDTKNT